MDALNADAVENDAQPFREEDAETEIDTADEFDDLLTAADRDALPKGMMTLKEGGNVADMKKFVRAAHHRYKEAKAKGNTETAKARADDLRLCRSAWKAGI